MDHQELMDRVARLEADLTRLSEQGIPRVDRSSRRRDRRLTVAYFLGLGLSLGLAGMGTASALDGTDTVFSDDIVNGTIKTSDIGTGQVTTAVIKDGSVTSSKVLDNAIAGVDVRDGSISGPDIADGSIAGADITDLSVGPQDMGYGSVGTWAIADGVIRSEDIGDGNVGSSDIADGSVSSNDIADGTIGGNDVADASLTGADINLFNDNQCNGETVQGTALVIGDPAVPNTYTTDWLGWAHSCSGEPVKVKRQEQGSYVVYFGSYDTARLAVVTPSTTADTIASVSNLGPGMFQVYLQHVPGGNGYLTATDEDFTILAY